MRMARKQPGQPQPRRTGETRYPWCGAEVDTLDIYNSRPEGHNPFFVGSWGIDKATAIRGLGTHILITNLIHRNPRANNRSRRSYERRCLTRPLPDYAVDGMSPARVEKPGRIDDVARLLADFERTGPGGNSLRRIDAHVRRKRPQTLRHRARPVRPGLRVSITSPAT